MYDLLLVRICMYMCYVHVLYICICMYVCMYVDISLDTYVHTYGEGRNYLNMYVCTINMWVQSIVNCSKVKALNYISVYYCTRYCMYIHRDSSKPLFPVPITYTL